MPTDSGTNDILSLGFLHYTTAVSREMSDEPLILYFGYAVISIWVFDDCILFAFLLHVFCSATANVLQYHCITVAVVLHIGVQRHCNGFAVALQNVCRILQ